MTFRRFVTLRKSAPYRNSLTYLLTQSVSKHTEDNTLMFSLHDMIWRFRRLFRPFEQCGINSPTYWTIFAPDKVTAVPVRRNGNFQTPISVPAVKPKSCHTLSNPDNRQDYTVACLNYTLQTMMPLPGWPAMAPKCIRQQQQPTYIFTYLLSRVIYSDQLCQYWFTARAQKSIATSV